MISTYLTRNLCKGNEILTSIHFHTLLEPCICWALFWVFTALYQKGQKLCTAFFWAERVGTESRTSIEETAAGPTTLPDHEIL